MRKVIGKYGYRNERLGNGDKLPDPLFMPVELTFCPKCKQVYDKCECKKRER